MPDRRILLVEDEPIVAMNIAAILEDDGYEVVGPAHNIGDAMDFIDRRVRLDGALIDLNLRECTAEPIADVLDKRGIPFALVTGYGREAVPKRFRDVPLLNKPCTAVDLLAAVRDIVGAKASLAREGNAVSASWLMSDAQGMVHRNHQEEP